MTTWLDAVQALLALHVADLRKRWATRPEPGTVHDVIDEILSGSPWPSSAGSAVAATREAIAADDRWRRLVAVCGLDGREVEWLALLAACEVNPRLTRVLGYLDDSTTATDPTPALGSAIWGWPLGYQPGPASNLVAWQIAAPREVWQACEPWRVDADIAAWLTGDAEWANQRADVTVLDVRGLHCLHPELMAVMTTAVRETHSGEIELVGPPGSGRRTLLAQVATALGHAVAVIAPGAGIRGLRTARLLGAVPLWLDEPVRAAGLTLVARERPGAGTPDGLARLSWTMPALTATARETLWEVSAPGVPSPRLIQDWEVTPADLRAVAAAVSGSGDDSSVRSDLSANVLRNRRQNGGVGAMSRLGLPYEWPDLVVPAHVDAALHRLRHQVLLRRDVLDGWEFRRLFPETQGITALFAGPSGTGKTMAAQVLARSLELDLFRIDLATIVSKYIGDTEKQLAQVFDEAERSNVVLLFDEADALFGQRTRVQDAHDRYANIEIDYLLQRIDTFRGLAVLATNRKGDLDSAFLRRLRVIVDFVAPAAAERLRLWQLALPPCTSTGEPITGALDHEWLATHLELTGAEIKSIALSAAFDARQAGELISNQTVIEASRRELSKRGAVLRLEPLTAVAQ